MAYDIEAQNKLAAKLEDTGPAPFESDEEYFLCSAAISLKRIADALAGNEQNASIAWLIAEYTNRRNNGDF